MHSNNTNGSCAAPARAFMALFTIMLAMGLALAASPVEAQPFAYVTNEFDGTVSVIDTATAPPSVVATVPLGISGPDNGSPNGVAVAPNGTRAYVADTLAGRVSVIDTATNTVVAEVMGTSLPQGVAVAPDGKHAYATAFANSSGIVSVIDTATNTVVAAVPVAVRAIPQSVVVTPDGAHAYVAVPAQSLVPGTVSVIETVSNTVVATVAAGTAPYGVAITPDGKQVYVTNQSSNNVSVIATASNTVVATVPVGTGPEGVAVTPDGKHAYVTNSNPSGTVSVIATATNIVVATVPVGSFPRGVAITPDGKLSYVTNSGVPGTVSVIETATNTVVATVSVGNAPSGVAIGPPGVPFLAFGANLVIAFGGVPNQDSFALQTSFILSSMAPGIDPVTESVTFQAGTFAVSIPPGSFVEAKQGFFVFAGVINGVTLEAAIEHTGTLRYAFQAKAVHASLTGTTNPVTVRLSIGGDSGVTSVNAKIFH